MIRTQLDTPRTVLFVLFASFGALGCEEETNPWPPTLGNGATTDVQLSGEDAAGTNENAMRVATFNAGLARNFVPYAEERVESVIDGIAGIDADVVCLQEVWEQPDIDALVAGVSSAFPHAYVVVTEEDNSDSAPACSTREVGPLLTCVQANCAEAADFVGCALGNCADEYTSTATSCQQCIASNVSLPLDELEVACTTASSSLSYGGHNGLVLLSKTEFEAMGSTVFESSLVQRAALHGVVDGVDVFCTHLAADLSGTQDYLGPFDSYAAEQKAQIDALLNWIGGRTDDGDERVLLGDFNTGPALGASIDAELVDNWTDLTDAGWTSVYLDSADPQCTYCASNPLVTSEKSTLIDHVLIAGAFNSAAAERIADSAIRIDGVDEGAIRLSDHYGVLATLSRQ